MSSALVLPSSVVPSNLHLPAGATATYVESDVYDICGRLKAISPRLHVWVIQRGDEQMFSICEHCDDGVERLVFKVGPGFEIDALDARVENKCRYLFNVPFEERYKAIARANDEWEAKQRENEMDELYETLGRPMWSQLEHDGFVDSRGVSYPKAGVAAPGKRR